MMRVREKLEQYRLMSGPYASNPGDLHGAFVDVPGPCGMTLNIIATDGYTEEGLPPEAADWEHVSVSGRRMPNWQEMCYVRDLFWSPTNWVVQFHPPQTEYVNCHPNCLHLWAFNGVMPTPPSILVGPR